MDPQLKSQAKPTALPGVFLIERPVYPDDRGFFHEIERRSVDVEATVDREVPHAQWSHSRSSQGVLRGIHVAPWNKCTYVARGLAQAVIVDARLQSPTFGQHAVLTLGEARWAMLFVPAGCGNAFLALSEWVDYIYSVDQAWRPEVEFGIAWNDPDLAIDWLLPEPRLSPKDRTNPTMRELFPERFTNADPPGLPSVAGKGAAPPVGRSSDSAADP